MVVLKKLILLLALFLGLFLVGCVKNTAPYIPTSEAITQNTLQPTSSPMPFSVPATSASAITSPPQDMTGINVHASLYGTGADPNIITLGPKTGGHPDWPPYAGKCGMGFELERGTPILAPIDMVLVGFTNNNAEYDVQWVEKTNSMERFAPVDDLKLYFESASPNWPGMIMLAYHLYSSPLLLGHQQNPDCNRSVKMGSSFQVQGRLYFAFNDDVVSKGNATACNAMIGRTVKRGELIGFAGTVGTHSFADFCFKVSHTSENPTVQKGNSYLHWVQPGSFFYWKCYSPDAIFPSGVLAYPFECGGYQLPAEQRDVNFKYASVN